MHLNNPDLKLGIVAVSRNCFPTELSRKRLDALVVKCKISGIKTIPCKTIIIDENDALAAARELYDKGATAAVVYLGNFGPEGASSIFIQNFHGPVMCCAAAEEHSSKLIDGRGDAYCGMLNLSYNLKLRNIKAYIPENPVGLPEELAKEIAHFGKIAGVWLGLRNLKIISFGPRPQDFYACNAPIKPLYDIGVEIMENSELDLLDAFKSAAKNKDIKSIASDMAKELGKGNQFPELLPKLAQFESALLKYAENLAGSRKYVIMANKCWPAFQLDFGFCPCYVNSRLGSKGMPVACEVDIYGSVSEYMAQLASGQPATLLDINNTVPPDMISNKAALEGFDKSDLFMGFHCGNTPSCHLRKGFALKYQLIMHRLLEPGKKPCVSRGTIEGALNAGPATIFRIQSTSDCELRGYAAEGRILKLNPGSFGGIGAFAVKNMARFYRHVLVGQNFPHHAAVAFSHEGRALFDSYKLITGKTPAFPLPPAQLYPEENPFS